jgi:hypothetical protein
MGKEAVISGGAGGKSRVTSLYWRLLQSSSSWGTRTHLTLTSIKTKHRNRLNLEPALIFAPTKIRPRIEVLACRKLAQSSH